MIRRDTDFCNFQRRMLEEDGAGKRNGREQVDAKEQAQGVVGIRYRSGSESKGRVHVVVLSGQREIDNNGNDVRLNLF